MRESKKIFVICIVLILLSLCVVLYVSKIIDNRKKYQKNDMITTIRTTSNLTTTITKEKENKVSGVFRIFHTSSCHYYYA